MKNLRRTDINGRQELKLLEERSAKLSPVHWHHPPMRVGEVL
jgi:hypothetical protein